MPSFFSSYIIFILVQGLAHSRDVKPVQERYLPDYKIYHNLTQIMNHVKLLEQNNPSYMKVDWSYKSRLGNPQMLIILKNHNTTNSPKLRMLLSFGEHSREFLPVESAFHLLTNITNGLAAPIRSQQYKYSALIISKIEMYIVIMMNPDGRLYVERTKNYCWRGTSEGVDLNRNFDWQFGGMGSSADKYDEEYRGEKPFSEPECRVLTELTMQYKFDAFFSLHSGIQQIYIPYADTLSKKTRRQPKNVSGMLQLAQQISDATGNVYKYGLSWQLNDYTADGTLFDYMAGVRKIPYSLAIELWGGGDTKDSKCFDLFNPPSAQLKRVLIKIHKVYESLFIYLINSQRRSISRIQHPELETPPLTLGYILLSAVIFLTVIVAFHHRLPTCLRLYPRRRIVSLRSLSSTFSTALIR
ncbi:unnamed protein product [Owenia fusiformis]|uniref:Peptidase M14 domain-containing protein n=1 Tax=Owenia fusiformis TaxID=6347 RepID=A0A8S4PF41_OWEFU|nr:unnamed protein product [Owenia fusiformis]